MGDELDLALFGGLRISRGGVPVTGFRSRKAPALLAYLAVAGRPRPRETLASLLWGELPEAAAQANLRNALANLRALVGDWLAIDRGSVAFDPAGVARVDVRTFEALVRPLAAGQTPEPAALAEAAALYAGDLLEGFSLPDAPAWDEWLAGQRARLRQLALEGLDALAEARAAAGGEAAAAVAALRRLLELEPWHEEAHRRLMALLAASGRRSEALAQYAACRRVLAVELGVEPAPETTALYERIRAGEVAPAAPAGAAPPALPAGNLPAPRTALIGRAREVAQLCDLFAGPPAGPGARLVTVTGAGGVGKTSLAVHAAGALRYEFPDGAWLVELAPLTDPALAPATAAAVLGVREAPGAPPLEALATFLRDKALLLVLDNAEHVLDACADLAGRVLDACPDVRLLATSREPLRVAGERVLRLAPLAAPELGVPGGDATPIPSPAELAGYPAVALFVERAQAAAPAFQLTAHNAAAIGQACARLGGLPLALELAAARVGVLAPEQIAGRLDDALRLLTGDSRGTPMRQQTLRATLDWSFELLTAPEQILFRRLAVFAGGFDLEAVEAVCGDRGDGGGRASAGALGAGDVLDVLGRLVDKSLVIADTGGDWGSGGNGGPAARHRLLEPVRQYARERLAAAGEADALGGRRLAWSLSLAERAAAGLSGPDQIAWLDRLEQEHHNLRAALDWCLAADPDAGVALAGRLWPFWQMRAHHTEGRRRLAALLAASAAARPGAPAAERAAGLLGAGVLALAQRDLPAARALLEGSLGEATNQGDPVGVAQAQRALGAVLVEQGDYQRARALLEASLAFCRGASDRTGAAEAVAALADLAAAQGDFLRASDLYAESIAEFRSLGDQWRLARTLAKLARIFSQGLRAPDDYDQAAALYRECLASWRALGDRENVRWTVGQLGNLARLQGHYSEARTWLQECLHHAQQNGTRNGHAAALHLLAHLAAAEGEVVRAWALYEESLGLRREEGDQATAGIGLGDMGNLARAQGQSARARALWRESLGIARARLGHGWLISWSLGNVATLLAREGDHAAAVRLAGAAAATHRFFPRSIDPDERADHQAGLAAARAALGAAAYTAWWDAGQAMTPGEAVTSAEAALATPPPPAGRPRHNLPPALTGLIGREAALAEIAARLGEARLLTLTGPGGVGKTRLALAAAEAALTAHPDGAWLVELAGLTDGALAAQAVAAALGVREQPGRPLLEALRSTLADARTLLVLDNCEHLIDACAALAAALLAAGPGVRVLATSRAPLNAPGEVVWPAPALDVPPPLIDDQPAPAVTLADVAATGAVRLFAARAAAARPGWALTAADIAAVTTICRRLDGLPLALELAAARLRLLPAREVAARLDDALRLLTGGSRGAPGRQQTLRATIAWSYALLAPDERAVLARLAVFAGGFTLEAAEAVGTGERGGGGATEGLPAAPLDVLDALTRLMEHSLVQADWGDEAREARYRLLETVRQFAAERLAEAGEADAARDRHAAWCTALAERVALVISGPGQGEALARLDREADNLRAALDWRLATDPTAGLRLGAALGRYWTYRALVSEGRRWLERLLALAPAPTPARAAAIGGLVNLLLRQLDLAAARAWAAEGAPLADALGDHQVAVGLVMRHGAALLQMDDWAGAEPLLEAAERRTRAGEGMPFDRHLALAWLGALRIQQGRLAEAGALGDEALGLARAHDGPFTIARLLCIFAVAPLLRGRDGEARAMLDEACTVGEAAALVQEPRLFRRRVARAAGWVADPTEAAAGAARPAGDELRAAGLWAAWMLGVAGWAGVQTGERGRGAALLRESLALRREFGDGAGMAVALTKLGWLDAEAGRAAAAARRLRTAEALWAAAEAGPPPSLAPIHAAGVAAARAALGEVAFAAAWAEADGPRPDGAIAEALADGAPPPDPGAGASEPAAGA